MASSTRSGRVLRHEGTSRRGGGNATSKGTNIRDSPTSSSKATGTKNREGNGTANDTRSSTASGYVTPDSYSLKNSSSEVTDKKMTASTPTSRKSERVEKKRSRSPLRRSERIEKNAISSSPGSKKLKESLNSPLKKKKKSDDKNGKIPVASTENQSKNNKLDTENSGISKKKTRLDARRYRALLQPKNDEFSDDNDMDITDDSALKGSRANSTSGNSKKVSEDVDARNEKKENIICGKYSVDDHKESDAISTCSRELADLTTGSDRLRKSARLSGKKKIEDKALVVKCGDGNPQSSMIGLTTNDNSAVENEHDLHRLDVIELEESGFVATSEGKSLGEGTSPGCRVNFEGSKLTKMAASLDSYVSITEGNTDICNPETSKADITSPPCETTSRDTKRCMFCNKLERVHNVSEAHGSCLCNSQKVHVLAPSVVKVYVAHDETIEHLELLSSPCKSEAPAAHSHVNSDEGNLALKDREHSPISEIKNGLVTSPIKKNVTAPLNVDRGTSGVSNGMHTLEEHQRVAHPIESPVAVQTDGGTNTCLACKHPGKLLCCGGKGCGRGYHLSCLCPPLQDIPPGVWLCHFCMKKKMESGVYSVSYGIESVWDVKVGKQHEKQYFVKYKGLAHVHNRWVPESQILTEAPMLAAKFDKRHHKEKPTRWKQEWTQPHRLLQRRQLIPKSPTDDSFPEHDDKFSYCYHEWLVKWKGLGYEHATWELESAPFLCSSDARVLIHDFESRQEEAKRRSDPSRTVKALEVKTSSLHKLTKLTNDCPAGLDNDRLNSVNRLREFWHKSQNAVFIDDQERNLPSLLYLQNHCFGQERIIKTILFLSSLMSHTFQPILVVSMIHCLSLWETEFIRLAPSINLVVYTGTKDVRKLIRSSEFYEEGGCVMFQVLLSHPDAILEDFDALDCIGWETLIIDECQNPRISKHLEQFKNLSSDFRLLLLSGQLKDNVAEYINLLSFLESEGRDNESGSLKYGINDTAGVLAILKEKLIRYLAYERKPGSSMFAEYWVPVRLSNVQLEQYCSALVSNITTLCSCSKNDQVGALRNILISTRKCCDHPYLVGGSLQNSLIKDLPWEKYLDIGVEASGKLHLLDKFLHEIKNQGLRVLILFQSIGGAGRNSIGDILDDFVRQRFGPDSYERVDSGLIMSKKLAALSKFNDKANGRFMFLIENRACLPSIKLSSVDAVVIFNSDWNPLNDFRALQRIHIESQFEHVKVFRLYSSCTVEEKVLIFAKRDMILDSNIQNITPSNSHLLLSWGALHLFSELDDFHRHDTHDSSENFSDNCFLNDSMLKFLDNVMDELMKVLCGQAENDSCPYLLLIKAEHSGASYSSNITLAGERNRISALDKDPASFWSDLLGKRYPEWKFISEPSQRIRKKVQHFEESLKVSGVESDEMRRKRRKLTSNTVNPISLQTWLQDKTKGMIRDAKVLDDIPPCGISQSAPVSPTMVPAFPSSMPIEPETYRSQSTLQASSISDDAAELHKFPTSESERRRNAQRLLHLSLKPEISELCDSLKLPDDVKRKAYDLLEYIMNNHHVNREPETILQAFKLSLCLRAAKFMKHMVDHNECLALAKKYLNYTCSEEQASSVYSKLRILKKIFSQSVALRSEGKPNSWENESSPPTKADGAQKVHGGTSESASSYLQKSEVKEVSDGHRSSRLLALDHEQAPVGQSPSEVQQKLGSLRDALLEKRIDLVGLICSKREDALALKQQEELSDLIVHKEEEKMRLKSAHDDLLELIHFIHTDCTVRNYKIKLLNQDFSKKMSEFDQHMKRQRTKLTVMQEDAMIKEQEIRKRWLEEASAGTLAEAFETLPLTESGFRLEEFKEVTDQVEACDGSRSTMSEPFSDQVCSDTITTFPVMTAGITDNGLYVPSTLFRGRLEDGQTLASRSSNMAEMGSLLPIGTSAEVLETVPPNMREVESIELDGESFKSPHPASDLMCNDMITTIPPISSGTTENHLDMLSTFSIAMVEDVQNIVSHSSGMAEVEAIQPNGMFAEIPGTARQNMAEMESIEPNEASPEIPVTSLPAEDGGISKDSGTSLSESLIMTGSKHMVPLQLKGRTAEIPETVRQNMVVPESIQPNEPSVEISAAIFPAGDGDITKDGETLFSMPDVVNVLGNQTEPNEPSNEPPTSILLAGDGDLTGGGSPFSESNFIDALGNQPANIYKAPSVETTSLSMETATPVSQSSDMAEVESFEPNRLSAEVRATIPSPEGGSYRKPLAPPQVNPTGNGPDKILIDSTVATTEAIADRDIHEGEVNGANAESALQNPVDLHSISHTSTNSCYGNSASSGEVLPNSEQERLAVAVGTGCDDSRACPQTTTAAVSFGDVSTSQAESTLQHTCTIGSTLLEVHPSDNLSPENGQASTLQTLRSEGDNCMDGTHSCQSASLSIQQPIVLAEAQVEGSNWLTSQSVLHRVPLAETLGTQELVHPESICCSAPRTEVPVQQSTMPAEQSNHLLSQSVHSLLPSANLLQESTHSEIIADTGVPQQPGGRLLQMLPMSACVHPHELHPDPLQNELVRIQKQVELRTKLHEDKKRQLKLECEEEIEKVRKKYAALLQDDEAGFNQDKKILETIYNKVSVNRILAEEFRTKFIDTKAGASASWQGRSSSSVQQSLQAAHTSNARRQSFNAGSVHAPSFTNLSPVATVARSSAPLISLSAPLISLGGSGAQVLANPSATGLVVRSTISGIPNNHVRSQFGHTFAPRSNLQGGPDVRASASRAPAPHLHRFRPQSSSMPPILPPRPSQLLSQQQLCSHLGMTTVASTIPPVHLPRPPYNGTYLPVASGQLPLSQGISPPSVELPRDLRATNVAADLRNLPQLVAVPSVHGRVPLKLPVSGSEMATSTVVTTMPADSTSPAVCILDDD